MKYGFILFYFIFVFKIVIFVPHSTIGLSLDSEAPARLKFELRIGCFDLVTCNFSVLINYQHSELSAFSMVIVVRCTWGRKEVTLRQNERCYRVCALLILCKQRFSEV